MPTESPWPAIHAQVNRYWADRQPKKPKSMEHQIKVWHRCKTCLGLFIKPEGAHKGIFCSVECRGAFRDSVGRYA